MAPRGRGKKGGQRLWVGIREGGGEAGGSSINPVGADERACVRASTSSAVRGQIFVFVRISIRY